MIDLTQKMNLKLGMIKLARFYIVVYHFTARLLSLCTCHIGRTLMFEQ